MASNIESKFTFVLKNVVESLADIFLTKAKAAELHSSQDMFTGCVSEMINCCVLLYYTTIEGVSNRGLDLSNMTWTQDRLESLIL